MVHSLSWLTELPIAHRGLHDGNRECWENSLAAFRAAIANNYAIECDVRLSADKVPVVFHDSDLKRLTGASGKLSSLAAKEVKELTLGETDEKVPGVRELLDLVCGRVPLIIELKGERGSDNGLVEAMVELLSDYDGPAALMSFDHWLIRDMQRYCGDIPFGLTAEGTSEEAFAAHRQMLETGISFVSYNVNHLPNEFVQDIRDRLGLPVITWTVRDKDAADLTYAHADQITFEGFRP
ncbi:glycerophosphodiester phosphodiesterase [Nitratireductor basaltis]|uniref:Glycerophosphoryl diester phosphodiesterase n=1 Tax=Nitratireductor basaltis TaxID=472175 RepID=A0A084UB59_9HYPH|nr:glycerophosphodiester phosphodiesterase [Nitratireductor basaltis]KFB10195.1 Glycerophosphoryl diester phosphodiesterase [Nitratireductor basaltis]